MWKKHRIRNYIADRHVNTILKYGLDRRIEAVIQQMQHFCPPKPSVILDIGAADGIMLRRLTEYLNLNETMRIGIDPLFSRVQVGKENTQHVIQADGRRLPFHNNSIDLIIATALFKHVSNLEQLFAESRRVLRRGGNLIATDPTPLGICLGRLFGHMTKEEIVNILDLDSTNRMLRDHGFEVLFSERFMLSPIPIIGSKRIERILQRFSFDCIFLNQVVCAEKVQDVGRSNS